MRPSAGLVSRGGVYGCWPEIFGSLGPMARTVKDLATLLDVMVGYDPEDPITARGVGHIPDTFTKFLNKDGLKAPASESCVSPSVCHAEPESEDFKKISEVFRQSYPESSKPPAPRSHRSDRRFRKSKSCSPSSSGGPGDRDQSLQELLPAAAPKRRSRRPRRSLRQPTSPKSSNTPRNVLREIQTPRSTTKACALKTS